VLSFLVGFFHQFSWWGRSQGTEYKCVMLFTEKMYNRRENIRNMLAHMTMKVVITPYQRDKLVEFFGEKGAEVVISHIDELDQTFGSASLVIRKIMEENKENTP
jgi:hypothetical protein